MKVKEITIETIRIGERVEDNVVILWTEDGLPHLLPDTCSNVAYHTRLFDGEKFDVLTPTVAALYQTEQISTLSVPKGG